MKNQEFKIALLKKAISEMNLEIKSKISYLNQGGCGHFADIAYKELKKRGLKPKIRVVADWVNISKKKDIIKRFNNGQSILPYEKGSTSFGHCYIKVAGTFFDGTQNGEQVEKHWTEECSKKGFYTKKELETALKIGRWNDTFDTDQIPLLKKIVKKHLKVLDTVK